jgi:hypothetical protein
MNFDREEFQKFIKNEIIGKYEKTFIKNPNSLSKARVCPICDLQVQINQFSNHFKTCNKVIIII